MQGCGDAGGQGCGGGRAWGCDAETQGSRDAGYTWPGIRQEAVHQQKYRRGKTGTVNRKEVLFRLGV